LEVATYVILFFGGFLAGVINTLAGNGSAITLSILILSGMPATLANATNRIGALTQTLTAVFSLRRTPRTKLLFKDSLWFFIPSIIGSIIGAFLAIDVDPQLLKRIIGAIMLILLITMIYKPQKWQRATDIQKRTKTWYNWLLVFGIAIYGGFLQMGIGIMLLSLLVLMAHYSLRDANIIKLVLALVFVIPAFIVFVSSGNMAWLPGSLLAIGQGLGAWLGARYILFLPKANLIVRYTLIIILSISSVTLLGIFHWIRELVFT
jgi:hypothetical protein